MGGQTPVWLVVVTLFFGSGFGVTWLTTRAMRKVEGIKNTTQENSVAIDGLNSLAQRQNDEIARKDKRIDELERLVARLQGKEKR